MNYKRSILSRTFDIFNHVFLLFIILVTLYPIVHVILASVSDPNVLVGHTGVILAPLGSITFKAYALVSKNPMILLGYLNTIIIVAGGVVLGMILTAFGAYFLTIKNIMFKKLFTMMVIFTLFFSGGLIPLYLTVKQLGIFNTYWAVILPTVVNTYNLIILRTAFLGVSDSMRESAYMDGANDFIILLRVYVPLALPTIAVLILFYAVDRWNSWFYAMIFFQDRKMFPLQLILREILVNNDSHSMLGGVQTADRANVTESLKYAVIVVATLPIMLVYPFLQKYFMKGVMVGALKE